MFFHLSTPPTLLNECAALCGEYSDLIDTCCKLLAKALIDISRPMAENPGRGRAAQLVLMRHIISMMDGVSILTKQGSIETCLPILRSGFEANLSLLYILKSDCERRGIAYQVAYHHFVINHYEMYNKLSFGRKALKNDLKNDPFANVILESDDDRVEETKDHEAILADPDFAEVEAEWQRLATSGNQPYWFSLFGGPSNVSALAKCVKRYSLYLLIYKECSSAIHAGNGLDYLHVKNGNGKMKAVRHPEGNRTIGLFAAGICIPVLFRLIRAYCPERQEEYRKYYSELIEPQQKKLLVKNILTDDWRN